MAPFSPLLPSQLANDTGKVTPGPKVTIPVNRYVRDVVAMVKASGKINKKNIGLIGEASIELYALMVNAAILEAEAHLESAQKALAQGKGQDVVFSLQRAVSALESANNRGAYHIQNDLYEIEAALAEMSDKVSAQVPVSVDAIAERIEEIHEHLFHVGEE